MHGMAHLCCALRACVSMYCATAYTHDQTDCSKHLFFFFYISLEKYTLAFDSDYGLKILCFGVSIRHCAAACATLRLSNRTKCNRCKIEQAHCFKCSETRCCFATLFTIHAQCLPNARSVKP